MEKQSLGMQLVHLRKLKGHTQNSLAAASGVAIRTIQRIEKDEVSPQIETIKLLAESLGVPADSLLSTKISEHENLQKKWLFFIHVSPLLGFLFPFSVLFPLFLWLHKKEDDLIYDIHGIKVINFQLSMTILYVLAFIALLFIQGWGFLFFILIFPFNFLVITYNIFKTVYTKNCYYPLAIPFLKNPKNRPKNKKFLFMISMFIVFFGCTSNTEGNEFEKLAEYEGKYEYSNNTSLAIVASKLDTTLYAVIDKAKYPLKQIHLDSFVNIQNSPVVFQRDKNKRIIGYKSSGQTFDLITREYERPELLPRKELFNKAESYAYQIPVALNDGLETGALADAFENPDEIIEMVKKTIDGSYPDVHSILIYKNDKLVLEEYFYGYDKDTPHQLRSATKPIIGGIMGIAIDQGFIKSEQEKLLPFFESSYPVILNMDDRKKAITIENFLMYRHGLDCDNNNAESKGNEMSMMESNDWVKFTLDLPAVTEPGTVSSYCTGCALTIGNLVEKVTDEKIEDFAKKNLFDPLGITNYKWVFEPNQESMTNFSQLSMTPRDLVKLGKVYKDKGKWNGKQILSESWVNKTFDTDDGDYGYAWKHKYYILDGKRYDSYLATGNGGQKISVWPELDMVTVFTGGNYNSYLIYGKSTPPNEMIPKYLLNAVE